MSLNLINQEIFNFLNQYYIIDYPPDWTDQIKLNTLLSLLSNEPNIEKYNYIQNKIDSIILNHNKIE